MTPTTPPEEAKYPCSKCGKLRTKAEGGTTFTVCDKCWDRERARNSIPPEQSQKDSGENMEQEKIKPRTEEETERGERMRVAIDVELNDFQVPNFVIPVQRVGAKQEGWKPSEGIPLSELDAKTLSELCKKFREAVFAKAGKPDPEVFK